MNFGKKKTFSKFKIKNVDFNYFSLSVEFSSVIRINCAGGNKYYLIIIKVLSNLIILFI